MLTVVTQVEILNASSIEGTLAVQSASFAAMTISVAWRRTIPLLAAGLVAGGFAVQSVAGEVSIAGGIIAVLIVMYSVASYSDQLRARIGGVMILASALVYPFVADVVFADEVVNAFLFVAPWALGRYTRDRRSRVTDVEAEMLRLSIEQERNLRDAVARERGNIARDLHDIVAHGVSMMVLQAGAARQTIETDPSKSEELLLNVEESGRQALDEMHLLLEVLKGPSAANTDAVNRLTISALADLADRLSSTGTTTHLKVDGEERPLSPGLEMSVYRIAQESLTNAVKHGDASQVDIVVTYAQDSLSLSVTDDGSMSNGELSSTDGNGLIGMRERAELFGGTLTAGPRSPESGWAVAATLPIPRLAP
jgi:signal transduction histidine kinase